MYAYPSRVAENHKFEAAAKRYKSLADDVLEAALAHYLPLPTIRDPKHAINPNNRADLLAMASDGPVAAEALDDSQINKLSGSVIILNVTTGCCSKQKQQNKKDVLSFASCTLS